MTWEEVGVRGDSEQGADSWVSQKEKEGAGSESRAPQCIHSDVNNKTSQGSAGLCAGRSTRQVPGSPVCSLPCGEASGL